MSSTDIALEARSRRLQQRVAVRPYDIKAIEELVEIAYKAHHHDACILAVESSVKLDLGVPGRLYLMYGKSFMRKWLKSGSSHGMYVTVYTLLIIIIITLHLI